MKGKLISSKGRIELKKLNKLRTNKEYEKSFLIVLIYPLAQFLSGYKTLIIFPRC